MPRDCGRRGYPNMRAEPRFARWIAGGAAIFTASPVAFVQLARGQNEVTGPEMTDFKAQLENHPPPNEAQTHILLEGARAQPRSSQIWITEARLKTFRTNGTLEMLAETPHCVFDSAQKTVSSPATVQIQSPDQRFFLEGEGFSL